MSYVYAYPMLVGLLGAIWLFFFIIRRDLHHQQLFVSLLAAPLGLSQAIWFYGEYWRPEYVLPFTVRGNPMGAEDIFFAFFIGGIGSVMYEVFFRRKFKSGKRRTWKTIAVLVFASVILISLKSIGLHVIWAAVIGQISGALVMMYIDLDLRWDGVMSTASMFFLIIGIYLAWFTFFPNVIATFWMSSQLSGIGLFGVPIEEVVWYSTWAMFAGVMYEFYVNAGPYKKLTPNDWLRKLRAKIK